MCVMERGRLRIEARQGTSAAPKNDVQSFEAFFDAESRVLFRRLCLITGDRYEAEEVMQDAFLKILERWDSVRTMDEPVGYLYRTAVNVYRKRSRRAALAVKRSVGLVPQADEFAAADDRDSIRHALRRLTPRQRAALVLTEVLGYTSEEAGGLLGVRPVTVRVLASQGRSTLRQSAESRHE